MEDCMAAKLDLGFLATETLDQLGRRMIDVMLGVHQHLGDMDAIQDDMNLASVILAAVEYRFGEGSCHREIEKITTVLDPTTKRTIASSMMLMLAAKTALHRG
jgi:hypothetical protein